MLAGQLKAGDGIRPSDVKYIVPKLAAMKALAAKLNGRELVLAISRDTEPTKIPRCLWHVRTHLNNNNLNLDLSLLTPPTV